MGKSGLGPPRHRGVHEAGAAEYQLRPFLRGEGMGLAYDGLWMCGGYPSMGRKRLGSLLSSLKKYHFVDGDVSSGTEYYYLSEDGTAAAKAYLGKNHKRSRSPRRGPEEFRRIER